MRGRQICMNQLGPLRCPGGLASFGRAMELGDWLACLLSGWLAGPSERRASRVRRTGQLAGRPSGRDTQSSRSGKPRNEFNFALHYHSLCCLDTNTGGAFVVLRAAGGLAAGRPKGARGEVRGRRVWRGAPAGLESCHYKRITGAQSKVEGLARFARAAPAKTGALEAEQLLVSDICQPNIYIRPLNCVWRARFRLALRSFE